MDHTPPAYSRSTPVDPGPSGPIDPLTLCGVVCARLCHDLAGTLGALSGMLEMTNPDGTPDAEALDLARACARELSGRLRLLRAAWGADTDIGDLDGLLPGLPNAERLSVDLAGLTPGNTLAARRLTLSLLLVAAGALPRGGAITLTGTQQAMQIAIDGARAGWPPSLQPALASPAGLEAASQEARSVAVAIAILQARALGLTLQVVSTVLLQIA